MAAPVCGRSAGPSAASPCVSASLRRRLWGGAPRRIGLATGVREPRVVAFAGARLVWEFCGAGGDGLDPFHVKAVTCARRAGGPSRVRRRSGRGGQPRSGSPRPSCGRVGGSGLAFRPERVQRDGADRAGPLEPMHLRSDAG